jgi:hypothetical protein
MPSAGLEPAILASERSHTYATDRAAIGTGEYLYIMEINSYPANVENMVSS